MKIEIDVNDKVVEIINRAYQLDGLQGIYELPYGIYLCVLKDLFRICCEDSDVSNNAKSLLNSDIEFGMKHVYFELFEQVFNSDNVKAVDGDCHASSEGA